MKAAALGGGMVMIDYLLRAGSRFGSLGSLRCRYSCRVGLDGT